EVLARRAEGGPTSFRPVVPAFALWAALAAWAFVKPSFEVRPGPTLLFLQPNISQLLKEDAFQSGHTRPTTAAIWQTQEDLANRGFEAARAAGKRVDCVIWAETMVPATAVRPFEGGKAAATQEIVEDRFWRKTTKD